METEIIAAVIGSGALSAVVSQALKWLDTRRERKGGVVREYGGHVHLRCLDATLLTARPVMVRP